MEPVKTEWVDLPDKWKDYLDELHENQPIFASYFLETEIKIESGDPPTIVLNFFNKNPFDLLKSNPSNMELLKRFFRSKLPEGTAFTIKKELDKNAIDTTSKIEEKPQDIPGFESLEELIEKEPILEYVIELFDGSLLE